MEKEKSSKSIRGQVRARIGRKSSSERSSSLPDMFVEQKSQSIPIRSLSVSSNKSSAVITDKSLPQDYGKLKKDSLVEILVFRELSTKGNMKDLIERLTKYDENKATINENINENFHSKEICESCSQNDVFHVTKSSQALAEHFCETCDEKICTQCKLAHKRLKISRNHKINPLHNFVNKNRVTAAKTVEELEESFANLSIRDESLPW